MEDDNIKSQEPSAAMFQADMNDAGSEERYPAGEKWIAMLRLVWNERAYMARVAGVGLLLSLALAFAIPKRYTTSTRLMPPDP